MTWDPLLVEDDGAASASWQPFELAVFRRGPVLHLAVNGELDVATSDQLLTRAQEALGPGVSEVCIDLAGVSFADASAVMSLLRCRDLAGDKGAVLRVVRPSPAALLVLDLTGVRSTLVGADGAVA